MIAARHCREAVLNPIERLVRMRTALDEVAQKRQSAIVGRRHHGWTLQLPASARRKTLNFDSSYIRFDDRICV